MRKLLFWLLITNICISSVNGQFTKLGGGVDFGSGYYFHKMKYDYNKSSNIAATLKGIYEISVPIHISPSFTYFIPHVLKTQNEKTTVSSIMFDINGHYVFNSLDRFEFYGLAGFNFLYTWKKTKFLSAGTSPDPETDNAPGLNLGAGSYIKLSEQFDLSLEAKYIISKYHQFMFNAGVLINIDWMIKHENTGN